MTGVQLDILGWSTKRNIFQRDLHWRCTEAICFSLMTLTLVTWSRCCLSYPWITLSVLKMFFLITFFFRSCMLGKFSIPDLHTQTPKYSWFTNRFLFLTGQLSSVSRSLSEIMGRHLAATKEPFCRFFLLTSIFLHLFIRVLNHLVLNVYKICAIRKVPSKLASNGIVTCHHYFLGYVLPGTTWCPRINLYPFCLPWGTSKRTLILAVENC